MTDVFSPKQKSALGLVKSGGLRRINLLEGSVRSGKTRFAGRISNLLHL